MSEAKWFVGQEVSIDGRKIGTISHVTPKGRATVNNIVYDQDGWEREAGSISTPRNKIEPLTPEIKAQIEVYLRSKAARYASKEAVREATRWLEKHFIVTPFRGEIASVADVEKAERLAAAITEILGEST